MSITIPVIDIANSSHEVDVIITPLSDDLYRVTLGNDAWELNFSQLGDLRPLIKEPKKLKEYKRRMRDCDGIEIAKKCEFYKFCDSPSKSKNWVCMQDKESRFEGCVCFWIYMNE